MEFKVVKTKENNDVVVVATEGGKNLGHLIGTPKLIDFLIQPKNAAPEQVKKDSVSVLTMKEVVLKGAKMRNISTDTFVDYINIIIKYDPWQAFCILARISAIILDARYTDHISKMAGQKIYIINGYTRTALPYMLPLNVDNHYLTKIAIFRTKEDTEIVLDLFKPLIARF